MDEQEFKYWRSVTEASKEHWIIDSISLLNGRGVLAYTGGDSGQYMRIGQDGSFEKGSYEDAYPHIGDAIFQPESKERCGSYQQALYMLGDKTSKTKHLEKIFSF